MFYSRDARGRGRSLLQLWCQQLAWQKCSQPGFQIPVTIMKRLLQTSLSEASSQEEWGPLMLSEAERIGGWNGDRPGHWPGLQPALFVQSLCTSEFARLSWASARVSLGFRMVACTLDHIAVREGLGFSKRPSQWLAPSSGAPVLLIRTSYP